MSASPFAVTWHHSAVVVSSLDDSIDFYRDLFGGEVETVMRDVGGEETAELHGLAEARFDLAFLRFGWARLEIFEFHEPVSERTDGLKANDIGASHIAFEVEDVPGAYEFLRNRGVVFSRPPLSISTGQAAGYTLAFCADPDGNRIELINYSGGETAVVAAGTGSSEDIP